MWVQDSKALGYSGLLSEGTNRDRDGSGADMTQIGTHVRSQCVQGEDLASGTMHSYYN